MTPKERRKLRAKMEPIFARHNLQPIYEMNFRGSYDILDATPPFGNIRMSKIFLLKLQDRGNYLARMAKTTLGGMSVYFRPIISGVDTSDGSWRSIRSGTSYELVVDYWDNVGAPLEDKRSLTAKPLFEDYNEYLMSNLDLPANYDMADFLVVKREFGHYSTWSPMTVVNPMYSPEALKEVASW